VFDCKNLVIAPGETKTIDAGLEAPGTTFNTQPVDQGNGYYGYYAQVAPVDESKLYGTVSDLTPGRADAIKQAVNGGQRVCIYAKMKDPKPTVKLEDGQNPIEKHWQVVRALVPVKH
jgi:hypothetical protein